MNTRVAKILLMGSQIAVAVVFISAAIVAFRQYETDLVDAQLSQQRKIVGVVNQSLSLYFQKLRLSVETAVLSPSFDYSKNELQDRVRYSSVEAQSAKMETRRLQLKKILKNPRVAVSPDSIGAKPVKNWQIFKGLPDLSDSGKLIAPDRRRIARSILRAFPDLHYVFEMDVSGDLVFLEPFDIQKNITSFNYGFRDYLKLARSRRETSISEGYISHDWDRTQVITVATPIFDRSNRVTRVFAASVSARTLGEKVFREIQKNLKIQDGTTFYLVDRHGHVVASSSGKNVYFPTDKSQSDENDRGNIRKLDLFDEFSWEDDILEKGNIWERRTKSWKIGSNLEEKFARYLNASGVEVFGDFLPTSIIGEGAVNWGIIVETPTKWFLASRNRLYWIFAISGLSILLIILVASIYSNRVFGYLVLEIENRRKAIRDIQRHVAHDIRSPVAALEMAMLSAPEVNYEARNTLKKALARIKDIANSLVAEHAVAKEENRSALLEQRSDRSDRTAVAIYPLVEEIVAEKRLLLRNRDSIGLDLEADSASYCSYISLDVLEFKRCISNLLDNAIEAIEKSGKISVCVSNAGDFILIRIRDNGRGIETQILPKVGTRGFTHGKSNGTGLGVYSAKLKAEEWGGRLGLASTFGEGTEVTLRLAKASPPATHLECINLKQGMDVVVLDDDESFHSVWDARLSQYENRISHIEFKRPSELREFHSFRTQKTCENIIYFVDFDLGRGTEDGLTLISELGIKKNSILVTSYAFEQEVQARAIELGIKVIHKSWVPLVEIRFETVGKFSVGLRTDSELRNGQDSQVKVET